MELSALVFSLAVRPGVRAAGLVATAHKIRADAIYSHQ
jgi:hypothetical protein